MHISQKAGATEIFLGDFFMALSNCSFMQSTKLSKTLENVMETRCAVPSQAANKTPARTFTGTHTHTHTHTQTSRLELADPSPQTKLYHKLLWWKKPMTSSRRSCGNLQSQRTKEKGRNKKQQRRKRKSVGKNQVSFEIVTECRIFVRQDSGQPWAKGLRLAGVLKSGTGRLKIRIRFFLLSGECWIWKLFWLTLTKCVMFRKFVNFQVLNENRDKQKPSPSANLTAAFK